MEENKRKLIVDTDPGVDDALALLLLAKYQKNFDIKLFVSTAGNIPLGTTTKNVQFFVKKFFNGTKLAQGIGYTIDENPHVINAKEVHGKGGVGNLVIPKQDYPVIKDCLSAMREEIMNSQSPVTLITLGPLSNIAKLFVKYPEVKDNIEEIHSMIGSIAGQGNIQPYAEFNAYYDVNALDIVINSGIRLVFNTFELGKTTVVKKEDFLNYKKETEYLKMVKDIVFGINEFGDPKAIIMFDVNSIMALIRPELYEFVPCDVSVSLEQENNGQVKMVRNSSGKNCYLVARDCEQLKVELVKEILNFSPKF